MRLVVVAWALLLPLGAAAAQDAPRVVEGRVLRPDAAGDPSPVRGQWVVLHRVGSDRAGPLDSVRTGSAGRFRFDYRASGSPEALYFVSATYGGIAYFSPPLRSSVVSGGDADILVYDASSDTTGLRVQGRHIVVSLARGPRREIVEIYEIENQGRRTVTARDTIPLWSTALPERAESLLVAPGDVSAAAVRFERGRAALFAPLSPGLRQIVITYQLPNDAFPVSFPMQRETSVLEVLMEDPRGSAVGVPLREMDAATIEGRTFRRLLAQNVPAVAVLRVDMPSPPGKGRGGLAIVIASAAGAMLVALVLWQVRRGRAAPRSPPAQPAGAQRQVADVDRLVAELAALDAAHEAAPHGPDAESEYQRRRAELKARVELLLAGERPRV